MSSLPEAVSGKRVILIFLVLFVICAVLVLGAGMLPWRDWIEAGGAVPAQEPPAETPTRGQ